MNEQNIMVYIYIALAAIGGAGIIVGYWTVVKKSLREADDLAAIQEHDEFMLSMKDFMDARLSQDPEYSSDPPGSNLELYEFYKKWMLQQITGISWKVAAAAIAAQVFGGLLVLIYYEGNLSVGTEFFFLFSCTICVALISLFTAWRIDKKTEILRIIDRHFVEMITPERAEFEYGSDEDHYKQATRLNAIAGIPILTTNKDIAANPRYMGEASFVVRGGVAFLAGLGFFLVMIFLGAGFAESVFPVFLITGLIGIPVIWFSLLFFWEARKKKRA